MDRIFEYWNLINSNTNSKSEIRNSKQIQITKIPNNEICVLNIGIWSAIRCGGLGIVSDFGIRILDFIPGIPRVISSGFFTGRITLLIFYAIAIAGLCFGQYVKSDIPPCHAEPCPELVSRVVSASHFVSGSHIGQYVKPLSQWDNLTMLNLQTRTPQFFNTMLMIQTEGESLKPKTSFWKQAGIYGLEFVGAGIGTGGWSSLCLGLVMLSTIDDGGRVSSGGLHYTITIGNALLGSTGAWLVGKWFGQNVTWWKSAIGSAIGSTISVLVLDNWLRKEEKGSFYPESIIYFSLPPLGATIGLNL